MSGLLGGKRTQINNTETAIGAVQVQNSAQGLPIPIVYGTTRITGNNIWYGDFTAVPHTDTQSSGGGKGGGGGVTTTNTTYTYTTGVAIGLCEGPISGIGQIWEQKNVTTAAALGLTEFTGSYAQAPWSYLTSNHPSEALGYRGIGYVATAAYQLGNSSSLPNLSFEVMTTGGGGSCVFSSINVDPLIVLSDGDLTASYSGAEPRSKTCLATAGTASELWYWEMHPGEAANEIGIGNSSVPTSSPSGSLGAHDGGYSYFGVTGQKFHGGVLQAYGTPYGGGSVISVLYNGPAGTLSFWNDGVDQGVAYSGLGDTFYPAISIGASITANYGASSFSYTRPPGYSSPGSSTNADVNPADVLSGLLTNTNYGAEFPSAQLGSLAAFSSYCDAVGIAISPAYTAQRSAMDIATELCQIGNSAPFWSEGMLKVTPYADAAVGAFTPDTTVQYQLTDDDFLGDPPVKVLRKRPADAYNSLVVQCKDRANNYNNATPSADDQASIDQHGLRPMPMITFNAICVPAIGRKVAQNILTRALYYLNTYEFTLGWKYSRLESMDLVGLTDAAVGLNQTTVRILTVEEDEDGNLRMTAEDFNPGVSNSATYGTQAASGYIVNQAVAPGDANTPVIFQPTPALAGNGTSQIWLGTSGGADWGGAEVWGATSSDGTYTKMGTVTAAAKHGVLTANLPTHVDPDAVSTLAVDLTISAGALLTVPTVEADANATISYVDGELLSYANTSLTSAYHYDITYLRRGRYNSTIGAHLTGSEFMRLDSAVAKLEVDPALAGTMLYIKLLSYNTTGGGLQSLAAVSPTSFLMATPPPTIIDGGSP